jgi:hypothetical protein
MPYEVQENTTTHGWCNCSLDEDGDGVTRPRTFATAEEAQAALDDYLGYLEYELGLPYVNRYLSDTFRVRYVGDTSTGD